MISEQLIKLNTLDVVARKKLIDKLEKIILQVQIINITNIILMKF